MKKINQSAFRGWWKAAVIILAAVVLAALIPSVAGSAINNLAIVRQLKTTPCDPGWFVCQVLPDPYPLIVFDGNRAAVQAAQILFSKALKYRPDSDQIRLHLAEAAFALGDRETAANDLAEIKQPSRISPLLIDTRYEAQLLQAYQNAGESKWDAAVKNFRLGLAWGDERTLPIDERNYFLALAELEKSNMDQEGANAAAIYRIGRYLAAAGEWGEAVGWLGRSELISNLPPHQAAWALLTIGRYQEVVGDWQGAILAYQGAIQQDPTVRQAYLRLIPLLYLESSESEILRYQDELLALGPSYHLGAQGENYQAYDPAVLPDGWKLVGYDLDEEMLEQAKRLEIVLWWQGEGKQPQGEGWLKVGNYWLQRQIVTNLFPNAGFEWGVDERGIPLGHDRELYGISPNSLTVESKMRNEVFTQVAKANNSQLVRNVALISRKIPTNSTSIYLLSGSMWSEVDPGTFGRSCMEANNNSSVPHYLPIFPEQPPRSWLNISGLFIPYPNYYPNSCEIVLMNDANSQNPVFWDNFILTKISIPN